jgi:hypothetical protein
MTRTEQEDMISLQCTEIRDICGRLVERKRELSLDAIEAIKETLLKLRAINNGLRW